VAAFDADLIIAGAGCAGLSALWQVMHGPNEHRNVIVIDRDFEVGDDRTWAFWGPRDAPFAHLGNRNWDQLKVRFPGWETVGRLRSGNGTSQSSQRFYHRVRQRDYDAAVFGEAAGRPNIRFVAQDIISIRDDHDGGVVELPEGELRAPLVLQSTRLSPSESATHVRHPLRQHFGGWEVRTQYPIFDPQVATLMDFDTDQLDATAFFYVLPEERNQALVEMTMFSLQPRNTAFYDAQIRQYLDRLGAGDVSIDRTEYGVIPMDDRRRGQQWGEHVWNLGTVGGMTKPTSGYTFQRIHAQAHHLISHWADDAALTPVPQPPARYRFADRTLLNILHHHPEHGRTIFERLFTNTSIDDVLTFLDEDSTLGNDARMVAKLPWAPFLRASAAEIGAGLATAISSRL
jgi:lycopene beta-cyclase|tara:strand:- start:1637 stop:2842 length:1206 start_codon:yes stop_codon:yes gene_type:complete